MPYPTTQWCVLDALREVDEEKRRAALGELVAMYGGPLFTLARHRSRGTRTREDCEDLVNDFLLECIAGELLTQEDVLKRNEEFDRDEAIKRKEVFKRADPAKGKFRNFLAKSFERYMLNDQRARRAKKRLPSGGELLSLQRLTEEHGPALEPRIDETPEDAVERVFRRSVFQKVLSEFEQRCKAAGQEKKYELFLLREVQPRRDGTPVPTYAALAQQLDIASENAANKILLAAREEFRTLLLTIISNDCKSQKEAHVECEMVLANVLNE
jgi:hypothetical protein